ncbi:hypothetical protein M9Y10_012115 [Tritrichomonas musculus]|uniref:Uncharacterized protein n=1 Tax=Tritrichomonas musculus TaxID=1915356 RepID=A0ABR2ID04_9EUKA
MYTFSNVRCGLIIIAAVTMGLFALGMVYAFKRGNVTINSPDSMVLYSDQSLPTSFYFPDEYDTPQNFNNNEWISATLEFIESTYRSFGIRSGFLNNDLYLKFDSDFYSKVLNYYCKEIGNGCPPQKESFVASTFPKLFEIIPDLANLFVYSGYCDSNNCRDIKKIIQANPINLEAIDSNWAITVSDIKQLLSESEQPLLMTVPYPYVRYKIPCDDHRANCHSKDSEKENFNQGIFTCPNWIGSDKKCTSLIFPAEISNGEFYKPQFPASIGFGPPITFLLYGWNDDFVTKASNSMSQLNTIFLSRGGFIVKRPLRLKGNSLNFYDGSLLFSDNDRICGSPYDPQRWRKNDTLICINASLCDPKFNYSIFVQDNGEHVINTDKYGISVTKMIRWNNEINETFDYDRVPYQNLDLAFNLATSIDPRNSFNPNMCGYWFLPYEIVESAESNGNWSLKKVHAINFAVKWTKSSYSKKSEVEFYCQKINTRNTSSISLLK